MAAPREILIESTQLGRYVKVTAVDTVTGTEASITGDARLPQAHLSQLAIRKLQRQLGLPPAESTPEDGQRG